MKLLKKAGLWLLLLGVLTVVCVSCGPQPGDGDITGGVSTTAPDSTTPDTTDSSVTTKPPAEDDAGTGIGWSAK